MSIREFLRQERTYLQDLADSLAGIGLNARQIKADLIELVEDAIPAIVESIDDAVDVPNLVPDSAPEFVHRAAEFIEEKDQQYLENMLHWIVRRATTGAKERQLRARGLTIRRRRIRAQASLAPKAGGVRGRMLEDREG
jgi:hypothetical protein